jgi:nucleotide-binding universal stress UspA family protein
MKTKLGVILLATDGSPSANNAARVAASLAREAGAALHVAHIWQLTQASVGLMADAASWQYTFDLDEQVARDILAGVVADLATVGVPVAKQHLRRGRPADEIPALADAIGADLIVVGSRGLGAVKRLLIGSTAEAVIHSVHRPVLVVRGAAADWPPRRIVVGDDASTPAANAVALAATIGGLCNAAGILVRVLPPLPEHLRVPAPLLSQAVQHAQRPEAPTPQEMRDAAIEQAEEALNAHAIGVAETFGARPSVRVLTGGAAEMLLATAEDGAGAALIVVGSRGLGLLGRLRLGSVSTTILHAATGSVLVVPPSDDKAQEG